MDWFNIFAQLTAIIGWLLLVYSYYRDDIDELLFVQIISSIFYCLSYFLLGAYSGLIVCFLELLKSIAYYKTDKDELIFFVTMPLYIFIGIFTYDGLLSLFPVFGSIIDGFSLTKNKNIATIGSIISNILWLIYDIVLLAYVAALTDGILVLSNIILLLFGYSRLLKTNKLRIVQSRGFSKNIYNFIRSLDINSYGEENIWTFEYEKNINSKSGNSLLVIKINNNIVGYLNYFVLNEQEYLKIINSEQVVKDYDLNNVVQYQKNRKNYLVVDSINVKSSFQNSVSIKMIVNKLKKLIQKKYREGYKIECIVSTAFTQFEKDVLERAGFSRYKEYSDKINLYMLNKDTIEELCAKQIDDKKNYQIYFGEQVTPEMLLDIKKLDKRFFDDKYLWDEEYQLQLFNKNKNSIIVVTYKNKLVGYLNYLVINKDKYEEMLNSDVTIDDFNLDEITTFNKNKKNYLTINSVVIDKRFQDGYIVKCMTRKLKKILKQQNYNNYKIAGINSIAISEDGKKFLQRLGFEKYKVFNDGNILYVLEGKKLKKYLN